MNHSTPLTLPSLSKDLWLKPSPPRFSPHQATASRAYSTHKATDPDFFSNKKNTHVTIITIPVSIYTAADTSESPEKVSPAADVLTTESPEATSPTSIPPTSKTSETIPLETASPTPPPTPTTPETTSLETISPEIESPSITQRPSHPWWKPSKKALLGVGIFTVFSGGILGTAHVFGGMAGHDMSGMGGHDMGGMDGHSMSGHGMDGHDMSGHDMEGMSHDDMMRVDGALNATPVTVEVIKPTRLTASVNYTGAIHPLSEVTVYPRVAGQLSNYDSYPGDRVIAGQTLATLDAIERVSQTDEAAATVASLQANAEGSQLELEEQQQAINLIQADLEYLRLQRDRFALLSEEGALSQDQYDLIVSQVAAKEALLEGAHTKRNRLQAQILSDQAQVSRAEAQVNTATTFEGYTQITAPISGVVQARMADPGSVVQPGIGILKIGDYQQVRLQANVAQQDANRIKVGTPISASVPGAATEVIRGNITSIFPQTDLTTRTVTVEAIVDNLDGQLLSGQFVDMEIMTEQRNNVIALPQSAIVDFNGDSSVWVVTKGEADGKEANSERASSEEAGSEESASEKAERRMITVGVTSGDLIEITSGLKEGDLVILSGHSRLMENSSVTIVPTLAQPIVQPADQSPTAPAKDAP
ncbi:MAG: efflux RND transporter periplasmic adaptor subunit [Cyanobacteria bacterium P01_F01_bin.53]